MLHPLTAGRGVHAVVYFTVHVQCCVQNQVGTLRFVLCVLSLPILLSNTNLAGVKARFLRSEIRASAPSTDHGPAMWAPRGTRPVAVYIHCIVRSNRPLCGTCKSSVNASANDSAPNYRRKKVRDRRLQCEPGVLTAWW